MTTAPRVRRTITLDGDVDFDVLETEDGEFLGLGRVQVAGTVLRSDRIPLHCGVITPDGVTLSSLRIASESPAEGGLVLELVGRRRPLPLAEWMLHEVRNRQNIDYWTGDGDPTDGPETLRLTLRPVTRDVGGTPYTGLSYQWTYASPDLAVYKLHDVGSWEVAGAAVGNEVWMRIGHGPPITAITDVEQRLSTEWYIPPLKNPYGFQYFPLQTELQGFTYTAHESGSLVTFATEVAHIRTLIEKPAGRDEVLHLHEHCGDLAASFATSPVEVLWAPSGTVGPVDRVEHLNRYHGVAELVATMLHEQAGLRRDRVLPYAMIEEWEAADLDAYRRDGLPRLLEAGVRVISLANMFQNNMNVYGVANMCCTVDLKPADALGLKEFCATANAGGAEVELWGNTAISTLTTMLSARSGPPGRIDFLPREDSIVEAIEAADEPFVRSPTGAPDADHYAPVFSVINLRDATMRDYWLRRWREAHDDLGVRGIMLDSSFNLSSDKFHWVRHPAAGQAGGTIDLVALHGVRPSSEPPGRILSMYAAHLDLVRGMQDVGYRYAGEDVGVFGVHRHGPDVLSRVTNLALWPNCLAVFDVPGLRRAGLDPDDVFFRGLAYRLMWVLAWLPKTGGLAWMLGEEGEEHPPTAEHIALLAAYTKVEDHMRTRTILAGEAGVRYTNEDAEVVWTFAPLDLELDGTRRVTDVLSGRAATTSTLAVAARRVLLIEPVSAP